MAMVARVPCPLHTDGPTTPNSSRHKKKNNFYFFNTILWIHFFFHLILSAIVKKCNILFVWQHRNRRDARALTSTPHMSMEARSDDGRPCATQPPTKEHSIYIFLFTCFCCSELNGRTLFTRFISSNIRFSLLRRRDCMGNLCVESELYILVLHRWYRIFFSASVQCYSVSK